MEWTREKRYQPYTNWNINEYQQLETMVQKSPWRFDYHIQPHTGLLNDPNGFSFFNQQWHLFYQSYPFGPVHGLKSWCHLVSDDLINWHRMKESLLPDTPYDSHGVYSGSAISVGQQLFLMYTGNVRDKEWNRFAYQMGAWMDKDNHFYKIKSPLIMKPDKYTDHFRDPQVFKYDDTYYCLIGAQRQDKTGTIVVYRSDDLTIWHQTGELQFTHDAMGYMIECPNLICIDGHSVLIFCPQGLDSNICHYQNIYPNTYVIGDMWNPDEVTIPNCSSLQLLDEGFDVYATQAFNAPDGRALAVSWIGLPDISYPSDKYNWAHGLSLVKELHIHNNHLYQYPVDEIKQLRDQTIQKEFGRYQVTPVFELLSHAYELSVTLPVDFIGTITFFGTDEYNGVTIDINGPHHTLIVNREHCGKTFAEEFGTSRKVNLKGENHIQLNLFVDQSLFELYINRGYQTLTGRVFPENMTQSIYINGNHCGEAICYTMKQASLNREDKYEC